MNEVANYFDVSPVFHANYTSTAKVNVNQGGTSSGKTYSIMQVLLLIAINDKGCIITVAGQDLPNLKKGSIRDMQNIRQRNPWLAFYIKNYNKTENILEFYNGSIIEFNSYDNEQDARNGKRDYLFINEANGVPYMVYWQLKIRTRKKVFLDYNPSAAFWVHEKVIGQSDTMLFISDHRHNPFIEQALHDEIEGIEDRELWKVYARGITGQFKGLIYPTINLCDYIPSHVQTVYGLDFGFNHKMAMVECGKWENRAFFNELIYQSEMTISHLIQQMRELGIGRQPIYCDSARPDAIEDLKAAGYNALMADKDVKNGIDFLKRHQIYYTKSSAGLRKEAGSYKWKETVMNGITQTLDEPVKVMDDIMDAKRYGFYTHFRKDRTIRVFGSRSSLLDEL